jgi:hypothetical protein
LSQQNGRFFGVRLRGLADLLWNRAPADPSDDPSTAPVVIDDQEWAITVQSRLVQPEIHLFLSSIARLEEASAARYVYRLDLRSAYAASSEKTFQDLMTEWQRIVGAPIPQSMYEALRGWWSSYGQVHLYEGLALLEVSDDLTLQELEASTSLTQYVLARLSPRTLVMRDSGVESLLAELAAKGYLPREIG